LKKALKVGNTLHVHGLARIFLKLASLSKLTYIFNEVVLKIPMTLFEEIEKNQSENSHGCTKDPNRQSSTDQKSNHGGITKPDLKSYYRAIVIKTGWHWHKSRHEDQWS
jgi:hypothetical protein